jgi:hypothetical protein
MFSFHRSWGEERLCLEPDTPSDYHTKDGGTKNMTRGMRTRVDVVGPRGSKQR